MKQLSICLLGLCLLSCNDAEPNDAPLLNPSDAEGISDAQGIADAISDTDLIDAESSADSAQVDADVSLPDLPGPQDSAQPDASEQNDAEISTDEDTASTADTDDAADDTPPPPEPSKTLCAPCTNNSECVDVGDEICARLDGDATACVQPCSAGCEEGYECGTVVNLEGDDIEACVPTNGPCACTDDYIGSETLCWTSNAIGSCQGSKVCTATGWTTCDASEATAEVCGGGDENCDGVVDEENAEGCYTLYADKDQDGFGSETDTKCLCDASGFYNVIVAGDCDDSSNAVSPTATEVCNELDDNCDGITDPQNSAGCESYWFDEDSDGWGKSTESICACAPTGQYSSTKAGDCTDADPDINPDQPCGPPVCNIFILSGGCEPGPCDTPNVLAPCPNALVCANESECRTSCSTNLHCQPGFYCDAGACVADKPDGSACSLDAECASKYCGGGFCCTGGGNCCDGTAITCDDSNPCTTDICNPDFTCDYANNTAPCGQQGCNGLTFVQPGTCDQGQCAQPETLCEALDDPCQAPACDPVTGCGLTTLDVGAVCEANACVGFELYEAKTCDASGECTGGGLTVACPNAFVCAADGSPQCATSCANDAGCQPDSYCIDGTCQEKKLDGEPCDGDNECQSDSCGDNGICCGGCCDFGTLGTNQYSRAAEICEGHVFEGKNSCARVISGFGNFAPGDIAPLLNDSAFLQLSTGVASQVNNQQPGENQNTDGPDPDGTVNIANDLCGITVDFVAPPNVQGFAFDFIFFSSEYPEWVGTQYNDTFNVMMTSTLYDNENIAFDNTGAPISINVAFFDICNGAGCTTPASTLAGTGYNGGVGGSTGWLTTTVPISGGEAFTLRFVIYDEGDHIYDSDVMINNFRWLNFVSGTGPVTE